MVFLCLQRNLDFITLFFQMFITLLRTLTCTSTICHTCWNIQNSSMILLEASHKSENMSLVFCMGSKLRKITYSCVPWHLCHHLHISWRNVGFDWCKRKVKGKFSIFYNQILIRFSKCLLSSSLCEHYRWHHNLWCIRDVNKVVWKN